MKPNTAEDFWDRVETTDYCWIWSGAKLSKLPKQSYGVLSWHGERKRAHRLAWELARGPIPKDTLVLHHCDNPPCVNPQHLYLGTHADNAKDRDTRGRHNPLRGTAVKKARLSEQSVVEIRQRLLDGERAIDLAHEYGVDPSTVSRVRTGANWAWL